ncbi:MAG: DUF4340 domain-containing protein [Candidatus Omnitrophota bacterium]
MKSMRKELIIIVGIILILGGYLILRKSDKLNYRLPQMKPIKVEDIDKIEIIKKGKTYLAVKNNSNWTIPPKGYAPDEDKIKRINEIISKLTLTDLASKAKNFALYDLDPTNVIRVIAYHNGQVIRRFDVGRVAPTDHHTFVKLENDDKVYYALDAFRDDVDLRKDELRDKLVMKFTIENIDDIEIETGGAKLHFIKKILPKSPEKKNDPTQNLPGSDVEWVTPDGKKAVKANIDSILSQLSFIICRKYIDDKTKEEFGKSQAPIFSAKLKSKSKEYHAYLYPKILETDRKASEQGMEEYIYPAISSESPFVFCIAQWNSEQILKKPEELIESAAKKDETKK